MAFFVLFQVIKWLGYKPMLGHDYIPQDSGGMKGNLLRGIVNSDCLICGKSPLVMHWTAVSVAFFLYLDVTLMPHDGRWC